VCRRKVRISGWFVLDVLVHAVSRSTSVYVGIRSCIFQCEVTGHHSNKQVFNLGSQVRCNFRIVLLGLQSQC
jgi:hypothetical protein